jgi:hypothetical protein
MRRLLGALIVGFIVGPIELSPIRCPGFDGSSKFAEVLGSAKTGALPKPDEITLRDHQLLLQLEAGD